MNKRILAGWLVLAAGLCGCAVDVGQDPHSNDESEPLAQGEQAIVDGTLTNKKGVVELDFNNIGKCTGVMINRHLVLTASRCGLEDEDSTYPAAVKVAYFDPALADGKKRLVTATPLEGGYDLVWVNHLVDRTGEKYLALIWRQDGWIATTTNDYQRLSLGSCDNVLVTNFFYGRGSGGSGQGNGAGVLRAIRAVPTFCVNYPTPLFVNFDLAGAACPGDIGGPLMVKAGQWDVVTAIVTNISGGTPACSNGGAHVQANRLSSDDVRDWIEEMNGDVCHDYEVEGHPYLRCWD